MVCSLLRGTLAAGGAGVFEFHASAWVVCFLPNSLVLKKGGVRRLKRVP
jgi:hypothetical protein